MRVKAQIDLFISIFIFLVIGIIGTSMFFIPKSLAVFGYITGSLVILFMLWLYFGTYYVFKETYLYCKSGPFFEKISYDSIKSLKLCQNMASSMALSRNRIEIKQHNKGYITGTTYISPKNREEFLKELVSRCKNLDSSK